MDPFFLSAEESDLAELLGKLGHGDFARIISLLSESAKSELRAAIGTMIAESHAPKPPES
jgi:hypothetical protein